MLWFAILACVEMPLEPDEGSASNDILQIATIGEEAVDLPLIDENGSTFFLADDRGKVIFLDMSGFH